jgi:hypothetical protein
MGLGKRALLSLLVAAGLAGSATVATALGAAAYGPTAVYQIGASFNCDNPGSAGVVFCTNPQTGAVELGGDWGWVELDGAARSSTSGTGDIVITFCGHSVPGPGAGASNFQADVTWFTFSSATPPSDSPPDSNNMYLQVSVVGTPVVFHAPATAGHYAFNAAPGVNGMIQIAKVQ